MKILATVIVGGYGETLYLLRRSAVRHDLRMVRLLGHLGISDVTDEDIDNVLDDEDNRAGWAIRRRVRVRSWS